MLGLHCFARAFSSYCKQGLVFIALHRFLLAAASLIVEHRLSSCGNMWNLPGPGIEPVSPALADVFLTSRLPGNSPPSFFFFNIYLFGCAGS